MFTGLIQALGQVQAVQPRGGDLRLHIHSSTLDWSDVVLGDSIATNGVCLTAVDFTAHGFWADVSVETLNFSTLASWRVGQQVNLEKALMPTSRLGGHMVSGHVDGVGRVLSRKAEGRSERFTLEAPVNLAKYIAFKGSIAVDGVSLTVNAINGCSFELNIVPHTIEQTLIATYRPGHQVNLEVDIIARYLERLMQGDQAALPNSSISEAFLAAHGYLK